MSRKNVKFEINPLLSGPSLVDRQRQGNPYREIALNEIDVDPDQPRRIFDEEALADLANSIKEHGVLTPILVKIAEGGTYRLVAGERRLRAATIAGLKVVPAVIDASEDDSATLAKQLVENMQREDLSSMERAIAIGQLKRDLGLSVRDIAKALGVSKSLVQRSLDVLELPEDLQEALIAGHPESKVLLLNQVEDKKIRKLFIERLEEFSRSQIEDEIKLILKSGGKLSHGGTVQVKPKTAKANGISSADERLIEDLQKALGTRVYISRKSSDANQGKLTIEFYSIDDLDEINRRLLK